MFRSNLKFVALSVPEIIGRTHYPPPPSKNGSDDYQASFSSPKFLTGFVRMDPVNYWPNLKSVASPLPEIIAIGVLGGGSGPPILGKRRP